MTDGYNDDRYHRYRGGGYGADQHVHPPRQPGPGEYRAGNPETSTQPKPATSQIFATQISIRLATVGSIIGFTAWVVWQAANINASISSFQADTIEAISELRETLEITRDQVYGDSPAAFRRRDVAEFCEVAERLNPGWKCPNPYTLPGYTDGVRRTNR